MFSWFKRQAPLPDPVPGQVWESGWNGERLEVVRVETSCTGAVTVKVREWKDNVPFPGVWWDFVFGLSRRDAMRQWRAKMRAERRTLVIDAQGKTG